MYKPLGKCNGTDHGDSDPWKDQYRDPRDTAIQLILSVALGIGAFITFCILRPRWKTIYGGRKQQNTQAVSLPELPDSFFGWILPLWRITEEQVLASAGLDAYVFLAFFKMAIKFLAITLFFALAVIKPVHDQYAPDPHSRKKPHKDHSDFTSGSEEHIGLKARDEAGWPGFEDYASDYLWMYLVFAYFFTAIALYLIIAETRKIIEVRQEYLGSQTTITDRTIRLSGIPAHLQSEDEIKKFVEELEIGKVESVTLCRNWKKLDKTMMERMSMLRRLEEAWTVHLGQRRLERNLESLPVTQPVPPEPADEARNSNDPEAPLMASHGQARRVPYESNRPRTKIWYDRFKLRYKNVDAIDYYEEQLRKLDEKIIELRKETFDPTPLAFVTMDSVASCQMAVQAVLDPSPLQLLANTSPAPSDVVWHNTYQSRSRRIARAWGITILIGFLSIFWAALLVPIAASLNTCSIQRIIPQLGYILQEHEFLESLVNTQLPTLFLSLMTVLVPYLYEWLANLQGMISQGDVELSLISKNFFFLFFNFFVTFTILGTVSGFVNLIDQIGEKIRDAATIGQILAEALQNLLSFYSNFVILQGLGLFPFRILGVGAISTYPITLIGAKTPRDYAELIQPPIFSYGFYLPQTILIFDICIVYSVLHSSWRVLLPGLAYFTLGHFVHKYQLLYAMDHRQHSTGRGWTMICDRVVLGLVVFQITMAGQLALSAAWKRSAAIVPLLLGTLWFSWKYARTYRPLMKYIALKSLKKEPGRSTLGRERRVDSISVPQGDGQGASRTEEEETTLALTVTNQSQTLDEARETGLRFVNPSLVMPLEDVWIADSAARVLGDFEEDGRRASGRGNGNGHGNSLHRR